jgi:kanamycin kinase
MARGDEARYLKVARRGGCPSLADERDRLRWAAAHLPVPRVVEHGEDEAVEWLLTEALPGADATRAPERRDPARLVPLLARALRAFHAAPVDGCPFDFRLDAALAHVRRRVDAGFVDAARHLHPEHRHLTPREAVALLESTRPAAEDAVVCHGDYCLPNVLLDGGRVTGTVDLGELGVADRWWDLAVATWSVTWNLGPGLEDAFLDAYGIAPDPERIRFYRLLYDLAS